MNIKIGILNVPKHSNKHNLIHLLTIHVALLNFPPFVLYYYILQFYTG